jgi:hypothetical protein
MATGACSECGRPLTNVLAKTCGAACRNKRARRLKRAKARGGANTALPPHQKALQLGARKEIADALPQVVQEELRPLVREAITEDVLRAASQLVALTPTMVDAITEDLNSSDKILRQKAYTLLAKYTLGNQSIAPVQEHRDQPMQVTFNLPRPGNLPADAGADIDAGEATLTPLETEALELRQCMECHADKPAAEFVGASERCVDCHEKISRQVLEQFA